MATLRYPTERLVASRQQPWWSISLSSWGEGREGACFTQCVTCSSCVAGLCLKALGQPTLVMRVASCRRLEGAAACLTQVPLPLILLRRYEDALWAAVEGVGLNWNYMPEDSAASDSLLVRIICLTITVGGLIITALLLGIVSGE